MAEARFAISADDSDRERLVTFARPVGLFVGDLDPDGASSGDYDLGHRSTFTVYDVRAAAISLDPGIAYELGNCWIEVLDNNDQVMGEYFLGSAVLTARPGADEPAAASVTGWLGSVPTAGADVIWAQWREARPERRNQWAGLSGDMRKAWLEVVALSSFRRDITDSGDRLFVLDGRPVTDEAGFYCAIGEAVNGPGGYFGWNLSALNDCLKGRWGAKPGFTLRWEDSIVARHSLTRAINSEGSFFSVVVDIFNDRGVDLILQ